MGLLDPVVDVIETPARVVDAVHPETESSKDEDGEKSDESTEKKD